MPAAHTDSSDLEASRRDAAKQTVSECDRRLNQYRQLLDEGTDPKVVARWFAEVQTDRSDCERVLEVLRPQQVLTADDVGQMVADVEDKVRMLAEADPAAKMALYAALGVRLTYDHQRKTMLVESQPSSWALDRVGGGTRHNAVRAFDAWQTWGSPHFGSQVDGNAVREVGITELRLPAA